MPTKTTRSTAILIRLTPAERTRIESAADARGLGAGPWLRSLGLTAAGSGDLEHDHATAEIAAARAAGEDPEVVAGMQRRAAARKTERDERRKITR